LIKLFRTLLKKGEGLRRLSTGREESRYCWLGLWWKKSRGVVDRLQETPVRLWALRRAESWSLRRGRRMARLFLRLRLVPRVDRPGSLRLGSMRQSEKSSCRSPDIWAPGVSRFWPEQDATDEMECPT